MPWNALGSVLRRGPEEREARRTLYPLQWHVFGLLLIYTLVVGPVARFEASWWLAGRLGALHPLLPTAFVTFFVLVAATYLARLRSERDTSWEHALRHAAVATIVLVPALVAALNQRGDGAMLAFAVTTFALPVLVYVRPVVVGTWLVLATTLVVGAAFAWQGDPDVRATVLTNAVGAAGFAGLLYALVDRFRLRALERDIEMRALGRLRDTLFHAIDHDLKTPLLAVRHVSRTLRDGDGLEPEDASRLAQRLERSTNDVAHVLSNLTAIGAPPTPDATSDGALCDVEAAVTEAIAFVAADAAEKGVPLDVSVGEVDALAACRHDTLVAILRNVVGNAVKFTPGGRRVAVTATLGPEVVHVLVEDEGVGMPPGVLRRVRAGEVVRGAHGTAGEGGSGVGLLVARALAATIPAPLTLANREGGGVRATLDVPRYRPPRRPPGA
ncbi:MAG: HAMP domain-containing sensor histidine kinase [Trueperaceae bacterium]|nr:HAMP domain-containing sensor histidine kinase [Trueperaceae bacterium]